MGVSTSLESSVMTALEKAMTTLGLTELVN